MADQRFYRLAGPYDIQELAVLGGASVERGTDDDRKFTDVAAIGEAGRQHVAFIDNRRYVSEFEKSAAGAILVAPDLVGRAPAEAALLITDRPYHGYARIARAFYPDVASGLDMSIPAAGGVDDSARVDPSARLGAAVHVGPGAEVGARTVIGPNTIIGAGVVIGEDCLIGANATLIYCLLGARVVVHGGVRIGQDGFGFAPAKEGHEKVPQLGRVIVGDDVEIGANTAIDRGAAPDTVIGAGTKIDNLVQIAHNVRIGENCLIAAQVGIAGSTTLGDFVMIGGQAGINGHVNVGDGVRIAAQAGVSKDVPPGATVVGFPAEESSSYWRRQATLNRLAKGVLGDR